MNISPRYQNDIQVYLDYTKEVSLANIEVCKPQFLLTVDLSCKVMSQTKVCWKV